VTTRRLAADISIGNGSKEVGHIREPHRRVAFLADNDMRGVRGERFGERRIHAAVHHPEVLLDGVRDCKSPGRTVLMQLDELQPDLLLEGRGGPGHSSVG
jgi:hypothetical protein